MYFSYLYGKQKEMLALRHLALGLAQEACVQPVIEPVKQMVSSLRQTLDACESAALPLWFVANPVAQDFANLSPVHALGWSRRLMLSLSGRRCLRPTLLASPALTQEAVRLFARSFAGQQTGLVIAPGAPLLEALLPLLTDVDLQRVFFKEVAPTPAQCAALNGLPHVAIERRPVRPLRRSDRGHRPTAPCLFCEAHLDVAQEGFVDFGDFTALPSWPEAGGAVNAPGHFHLTYLRRGHMGPAIWLQHFVGDGSAPRERGAEQQFRLALQQFRRFVDDPTVNLGPTEAVHRYLNSLVNGYAPSQALNKQWEVMHHLELVSGLLSGRFTA